MSEEIKTKSATAGKKSAKKKATRREQLQKLLARKSGVTIGQIQKAFGWQPHTARAAISAQRKAGLVIERSGTDKGTVYRIAGSGGAQ